MTTDPVSTIRLLGPEHVTPFHQLRILALTKDQGAFLSDLETENRKHPDRFRQELLFSSLRPPYGYYGCWVDHHLVGYVQLASTGLSKQEHLAFLYNLYIHPDYRGRHLASQLLAHIKAVAQQAGIEKLLASCIASNQVAQRFYQRQGFEVCGHRVGSVKWQNQYDDEIELMLVVK